MLYFFTYYWGCIIMKKQTKIIALVFSVLALCACSCADGGNASVASPAAVSTEATSQTGTTAAETTTSASPAETLPETTTTAETTTETETITEAQTTTAPETTVATVITEATTLPPETTTVETTTVATTTTVIVTTTTAPVQSIIPSEYQDIVDKIIKKTNECRKAAGLNELQTYTPLSNAAQTRANELLSSYSHTRPDGRADNTILDDLGIKVKFRWWGENIATLLHGAQAAMTSSRRLIIL